MNEVLESPSESIKTQKHLRPDLAKLVVLIVAVGLALLRIAPAITFQPDDDRVFLGFPYSIEDTLQYADFAAQARDHGSIFFSNRFSLDHEVPRLVILPIYLIGRMAGLLGVSIATAWSMAQAMLIIVFVLLWYWFVGIFFKDPKTRLFAFLFVLLAGGLDAWVVALGNTWPQTWAQVLKRDLWVVLGWTPYMTMYNPLYLAGWIFLLPWLALVKKAFENKLWAAALAGALLPLGYLVHAYDSMVAIATVALIPVHALLVRLDSKAFLRALVPAAIIVLGATPVAYLVWWQMGDPLFAKVAAESSSGLFVSPAMWFLGFGGILLAALYGLRQLHKGDSGTAMLFGWLAATALLSFSPFFEGRHFLYFVSLPLGLVAVHGLVWLSKKFTLSQRTKVLAIALLLVFFGSSFIRTTLRAFSHPYKDPRMTISRSELAMAKKLRHLPNGGILASRRSCMWLPHLSDHRCVMGHWFLSWDMAQKMAMFKGLVSGRISPEKTDSLLRRFGARYLFWGPLEASMGHIPRPDQAQLLPLAQAKDTLLFEIRPTDEVD